MIRKGIATIAICAAFFAGSHIVSPVSILAYSLNAAFADNFHEVVSKRLYRSAAMSDKDLKRSIKRFGIRSVIDLRMSETETEHERNIVEDSGVQYFHVRSSGSRPPKRHEIQKLLQTFDEANTPVLIHCTSGVHRTGLASALWLVSQEGMDPQLAGQQMSDQYGFIKAERIITSLKRGRPTADAFFWEYTSDFRNEPALALSEWIDHHLSS